MENSLFIHLGIALILALLSSKVVKKMHLPNVTGYLLMGILAGPFVLGILSEESVASFHSISEFALGFIAFSIGAEFKLSYLKKAGKAPIIIAILEALLAVVFVDVALIATGHNLQFSLMLGAIAAATAPAATLMVVRQYKAKGPVTETLMPVVAIDDAIALMLFGISLAAVKALGATGTSPLWLTLVTPVLEIILALLLGAVMGVLLMLLVKWFSNKGNRLAISIAMIAITVGLSKTFGLSELLSVMSMSAVFVNLSKDSEAIFSMVDGFTPPIFMLFFFFSGADLNIGILPSVGMTGLIYVVVRVLGKVLGATLGASVCNSPEPVKKYLGFTLIPQAGVAIGLATLSLSVVPEFGQAIKVIILAGTVIYELVGPVATKIALTKAGDIEPAMKKKLNPAL
ncbi:cation:proton antiporter [Proteiniclasticum ruminis]|uniref:cation:proton antiporter n=1 Tax=Proteiniclasticum ruminis TaxID=398199 RepID=UPI0028AD5F42|nr:cation:proton antiporter [Proteiniclasticum ruminis]